MTYVSLVNLVVLETHVVLRDILQRYIASFEEGDARKFVTEFYHPHCTMVHRNVKCYYGHEGSLASHFPQESMRNEFSNHRLS